MQGLRLDFWPVGTSLKLRRFVDGTHRVPVSTAGRGPGMSGPEITVGLSISLSGRFQLQGQQALHGYLLWQSYINGLGGVAIRSGEKKTVRLIWYDDRGQINWAQKNVLRLLQQDRIDILLGPYSSSLTMAVAGIAQEYKKVLWNAGGTSDEIFARGWRYLVGVASPASHYLRKLPLWLGEHYPALVRICVLYSGRGTFGWRVAHGLLDSALAVARHSVHLVPVDVPWEHHDTLLGVLSGIAPDVVVLSGSFQGEVSLMRTRSRWPRTVGVVAAIAAGLVDFSAELDEIADGVVGPSQWEPGVIFPDIAGPGSDWFQDNFQGKFGQAPDYIAAGSFATGLVLSECMRRCSSLDNEKLRDTAANLDCNTFYGRFRIDSRTGIQTGHNALLIRWQGGRKMVLLS